jgi:deoxycytidylate deaminase
MNKYAFDWHELAFGSKKPVRELNAIFIAAPRELTARRFTQLVKEYLPKGNLLLGIAKDEYVLGLEDQPQFRMLRLPTVQGIIDKVNATSPKHKIYTLSYFQREQKHLLEKLKFKKALFINGSWKLTFHTGETYYTLMQAGIDYERVSPFASDAEARDYETAVTREMHKKYDAQLKPGAKLSPSDMLSRAQTAAYFSFDHSYQTGVALGKKADKKDSYELLGTTFNNVVPYQSYAWHNGPAREANFSPPSDLNFYDTVHAEVAMLIKANAEHFDLAGTTFFINLLPCPGCARMLSQTPITEFVYREDHSDGYGVKILQLAGKTVRRVVT